MAAAKDELVNLDDDWEAPPAAAQPQPVTVSSSPPDLRDLDDGWNADGRPSAAASSAESVRGTERASVQQETAPVPSAPWLTKRQRRELAKQQRRHATQRRAERKQARKLERREQAKQRAAERPSSVVVRVAAKDTRSVRTREAAATARASRGGEARRSPPPASGTARPERGARPLPSVPREPRREAERNGAVRVPASAGRQRKMSWALYLLIGAMLAAFGVFAWLR